MDEATFNTLFPGCVSLGFMGDTVKVRVQEWDEAWKLNQSHLRYLAGLAKFLGYEQLEIHHNTPGKPPIPILAKMADTEILELWEVHYKKLLQAVDSNETMSCTNVENVQDNSVDADMSNLTWQTPEEVISYLRQVDARSLLEFELEMISQGLIVSFTSQRTNRCIKSGDLADAIPGRSIWRPYKYRGFNYMIAWDTDFSGKPSDEFSQMQALLQRDGFVPDFEYNLRRPGDNALVRYQSSFYLFPDPAGEPGGIRACVSRQQDFRVIETGDFLLAGR